MWNVIRSFISPLERTLRNLWFQHGEETDHTANATNALLKDSPVIPLLDMAFSHSILQTSHHLTIFCGDSSKKEFIRITHETWN
jgi:hypothetical protein